MAYLNRQKNAAHIINDIDTLTHHRWLNTLLSMRVQKLFHLLFCLIFRNGIETHCESNGINMVYCPLSSPSIHCHFSTVYRQWQWQTHNFVFNIFRCLCPVSKKEKRNVSIRYFSTHKKWKSEMDSGRVSLGLASPCGKLYN